MSGTPHEKQASATVYLVEELGDARLLCEKLKKYVDRAIQLIEQSDKRDHFFEVAGDIIEGLPKTTQDLHKALQAVALATNRLDYEEVKQTLPAEKVEELEEVLDEIRLHPVRRQNMKPEDAVKQLHALAAATKQAGEVPVDAALDFIAALEDGKKTASVDATAENFTRLAEALANPPEGVKGVSRGRLAALVRQALAHSLDRPSLTASRVATRVAATLSYAEQYKLMKGHPPKVQKNQVMIYSPIVGKYIPQGEWGSPEEAKKDLQSWEKAHGETLRKLSLKAEGESKKAAGYEEYKFASDEEDESFESKEAKGVDIRDLKSLQKALEDIIVESGKGNADKAKDLAQKALRNVKVAADEEEKESRYEEGKPADPTKNMSPDDAKKWKENVDHDGSNIKKEAKRIPSPADMVKIMEESVDMLVKARGKLRYLEEDLGAVLNDVNGTGIVYSGGEIASEKERLKKFKKKVYDLDFEMRLIDEIKSFVPYFKRYKSKTASDEEKESKFEEGKPADPTKNMSPEDAKKWKENVDHDGSNIKDATDKTAGKGKDHIEKKMQGWKSGDSEYLSDMARGYRGHFKELMSAAEAMAKKGIIKFDGASVTKTASDEEKESRYEEGKPADPTKDMSPEDAKEWKQNTEEHKDKFKAADWKTAGSLSDKDLWALALIWIYKPSARSRYFSSNGLGEYGDDNAHIKKLLSEGVLSKKGNSLVVDKAKAKKVFDANKDKIQKNHKMMVDMPMDVKNSWGGKSAADWKAGSSPLAKAAANDYTKIRPGAEVTLVDSRGKQQTGTAKSKSPAGWVIDMGGRTSIASPDNTVRVKTAEWEMITLYKKIKKGDKVTIDDPGLRRKLTGVAIAQSSQGWTLKLPSGGTAVANPDNLISVK